MKLEKMDVLPAAASDLTITAGGEALFARADRRSCACFGAPASACTSWCNSGVDTIRSPAQRAAACSKIMEKDSLTLRRREQDGGQQRMVARA